jgi:hypothetical protein
VQFISAATKITATEQVLNMLGAKYGRPSRNATDEWLDRRTGQVVRRTPIYYWDLQGVQVEFHAQDAWNLTNSDAPKGRVDVRTPVFGEVLRSFEARAAQSQPARGKF